MLKFLWTPLALACVVTACGSSSRISTSSSGGTADVSGTADANSIDASDFNTLFVIAPIDNNSTISPTDTGPQVANFIAADAVSFQYPFYQGVAGVNASIVINSTPGACDDENSNAFHVGETQLVINITDVPDPNIVTNTYVFPAAANAPYEIASATYAVVAAPCYYNSTSLVSGQVIVTDVQPTSISGSYHLQFSSGTISGTFSTVPTCAAVAVTPASGPVCN